MTDPITPPLGWVLDLLNEARKRAKSSGCFGEVDYVYMVNKSAQMGWDQRGAATEAELQQRADQELETILEMVGFGQQSLPEEDRYLDGLTVASIRAARRPKPPSLKEVALEDLRSIELLHKEHKMAACTFNIRRALEVLPNE